MAVRDFHHRPYRRVLLFIPTVMTFLFISFFSIYVDHFFLRTVYISLASTLQLGFISLILFREAPFQNRRSQWLTGSFFATGAALWFIRLLESLISQDQQPQFSEQSIILTSLIIVGFGVVVFTSMGFLLMIRERTGEALRESEEKAGGRSPQTADG